MTTTESEEFGITTVEYIEEVLGNKSIDLTEINSLEDKKLRELYLKVVDRVLHLMDIKYSYNKLDTQWHINYQRTKVLCHKLKQYCESKLIPL